MDKKLSLEEATLKNLYNELESDNSDVNGLVDGILVVTDPDVTPNEYQEIIDRAQEIVEDTPDGEIPMDDEYLGEYAQICPICGSTFIDSNILQPGDTCPICYEQPESFVLIGTLQDENIVDIKNGNDANADSSDMDLDQDTQEDDINDADDTQDLEKDLASKQIYGSNKLTESMDSKNESSSEPTKDFVVINATESDIETLEQGSAFTWEGMSSDEDNLQSIVNFFKENTPSLKLPVKFYVWSGRVMNDLYDLVGDAAYPEDLSFVSIPLDCWSSMGNLPIIKFQVGARWLDDIVNNNKIHMGNAEDLDEHYNKTLKESLNIKGIESLDNIADTFKYYKAYEANFKPLTIVKMDKTYYIYKSDAKSYNDYIDYGDSKDYIEGWLHGAVKVKNKVVESSSLQEKNNEDRIAQLMNIIDDAFDVKLEGKCVDSDQDKLEEDKLEEVVRLTSIPGVTRTPETDFSDDGNRFTTYLYRGVVPISYLKDKYDGDIYLTIAFHHLDDINYDEYKQFDSYKKADEFNGVSESQYDATEFASNLEAAYNDIVNFRKNIKPVDDKELNDKIEEINKACKEYKQRVENFIKEHSTEIINLDESEFRHLKQYVKEAGEDTADYIREASESSKRDFMSTDIESLKRRISNSWQFEYIENMFSRHSKNESVFDNMKAVRQDSIDKGLTSENKKVESLEDKSGKYTVKAKVWDENQDNFTEETYTVDIDKDHTRFINYNIKAPMMDKYNIPDEDDYRVEVISYLKENKNLNEKSEWDSEKVGNKSWNINGWNLEQEPNGNLWLYNTKGLGGSLIFYPDNQDELTEYQLNNQQVLGFEGNYLPDSIYNKLIKMFANGEFGFRKAVKESVKLQETGEWDNADDEMKAWLEDMKVQSKELADKINGEVKSVKGFDKYQGPFAVIKTPLHNDVKLWYDPEDDSGLSFICELSNGSFITGDINNIADLLNMENIPDKDIITENKMLESKSFDKWLDTFISEKGIDTEDTIDIETADNFHMIEIQSIIDMIKATSPEEQQKIKNILVKLDFNNASILPFLQHLATAIANNYDNDLKESVNIDGFENYQPLVDFFKKLNYLPDKVTFEGNTYEMTNYGSVNDSQSYAIYSDVDNEYSYFKIYYTLNKLGDNRYKGIKEFTAASDLREGKTYTESLVECLNIKKFMESKVSFDNAQEELKYLYAWLDNKENRIATRYVKDAGITDTDTLDKELDTALSKDDTYNAVINRINELENITKNKKTESDDVSDINTVQQQLDNIEMSMWKAYSPKNVTIQDAKNMPEIQKVVNYALSKDSKYQKLKSKLNK